MTEVILSFLTDVIVPLAWPAVTVVGVWAFKSEIREVMTRVVKAGPTGIEMRPQDGSSGTTLKGEAQNLKDDTELKPEDWGYLQPWLDSLERNLERNGKTDDLTEVKRIAAAHDRRASAQFVLRTIFGTQYEALMRMLDEPQSLSDLDDLFKRHVRKAGERAYPTPESWMGWLTQNGISYLAEGQYAPTEHGRSMVDLIAAHSLSARDNAG